MKVQVNVPQLQQALMTNAQLQNQMAGAQQLQQGNGYAGGLGILGAALGGFMQGRKAKELAANEFGINQQIAAFQEQKAQELAMAEQARAEQEYKRKLAEKEQERAFEMQKLAAQQQGQLGLEQFRVNNRQAPQMSAEQQWLNSLPPEQRNQIFAQKYAGQQNSLLSPEDQARKAHGLPTLAKEAYSKEQQNQQNIAEFKAKDASIQESISVLKDLQTFANAKGFEPDIPFNRADAGTMSTKYENAKQAVRNLWELGTLQEGDKRDLEKALENPTSFWGWMGNVAGGNEDKLNSQLGVFIDGLEKKRITEAKKLGIYQEPLEGKNLLNAAAVALQELGIQL